MTIREMMAMYHSLQFVEELLDYIEQYPDDDYMTMECLCRKLHKHGLIEKKDGEWTTNFIERKDEPQAETHDLRTNTHACVKSSLEPFRVDCDTCRYRDEPSIKCDRCDKAVHNNYEPQTESLKQFRVGLEYHTDTTHFGKVKGESITTNKVEDESQTERSE